MGATKDLDLTVRVTSIGRTPSEDLAAALRERLQLAASVDLGDFFVFNVGEASLELNQAPEGGSRLEGYRQTTTRWRECLVGPSLCTAPPQRGHRDYSRRISRPAGAQRPQNRIKHGSQFLRKVLGEKT
jgi:hypothetical protein